MTIRAIVFDLDDTLIVDEVISREAMKATAGVAFRSHGAQVGPFLEAVKRLGGTIWDQGPLRAECEEIGITLEECLWGGFESQARLREWALEARRRLFDAALREQGIEDEEAPEELAVEFATARRKLQRLMPDAAETIRRLKSSFLIGLLTNGDPDLQRGKIHDSGLGGFFDAVVVSGEIGIGKPRPEAFQRILAALGVAATEAVMVGNSLQRDILGAKKAGLAASIWLQVPGSEEFADVLPDATITGLHELPALLEGRLASERSCC
jgi:putative hydrolase of the HAD superfamily